MIQARPQYILFFAFGITLLFGGDMAFAVGQSNFKFDDMNLKTNSLNLSEPFYQAITGKFLAAKDLSTTPFKVAEESFLEESVMRNVGNVTNNMNSSIRIYLLH